MEKSAGTKGFGEDYWNKNYSQPKEMDGIGNAKEHAKYLKSLFSLDYVDISSVIDFGAGHGDLFKQVLSAFKPFKAHALEPSPYAFKILSKKRLTSIESTQLKLHQTDLLTYLKGSSKEVFDLGICTSVFQYLTKEEMEKALPLMAKKVRYLYFSVPTDKELKRQVKEIEFDDTYANKRSSQFYKKIISKSFTIISSRLLESKVHYNEDNTPFTELLFRF